MSEVAIDLQALATWLDDHGVPVVEPLSASRVGMGQSNLTYRVDDAQGRSFIARRPPLGTLLQSAHDVGREHRIMAALQDTPVPVPRTIGLSEPGVLADVPVFVMSHVEGLVINDKATALTLPEHTRYELGLTMARTLAQINAVDIDQVGLGDLASHSNYAARQLKRWTKQWEGSHTRELPALDRLTALLTATMPEQTQVRLVHGDYHLRNLICDPADGGIRAVLDWELSTLGDPMADAGSMLAYWAQPGDTQAALFDATTAPGFPSREELADAYLQEGGGDRAALDYWHVLALWKIAIIIDGVRRRAMDNPGNEALGGAPPEQAVDALVDRAWTVAQETGLARSSD